MNAWMVRMLRCSGGRELGLEVESENVIRDPAME